MKEVRNRMTNFYDELATYLTHASKIRLLEEYRLKPEDYDPLFLIQRDIIQIEEETIMELLNVNE